MVYVQTVRKKIVALVFSVKISLNLGDQIAKSSAVNIGNVYRFVIVIV